MGLNHYNHGFKPFYTLAIVSFTSLLTTLSALNFIICGIILCSILGLFLFNVYFNDSPRTLLTLLALYGNHTIYTPLHINLTFSSKTTTSSQLIHGVVYLWRIKINESKTAAVYFSKTFSNPNRLTINNIYYHPLVLLFTNKYSVSAGKSQELLNPCLSFSLDFPFQVIVKVKL